MKGLTAATRILITIFVLTLAVLWSEPASSQSFVAQYSRAKTQNFDQYNQKLKRGRFLEQLADRLSAGVSLPEPVVITIAECGSANAFYNPQHRTIVMCYELIGHLVTGMQRSFAKVASQQEILDSVAGGIFFILMHELGHTLIHVLDLPVLGREEDAADQIAAYLLLNTTGNSSSSGLAGALWFFRSNTLFYTRRHFSSEHSLGPQRQSNLACWAFGKDPQRYQYLLVGKYLTRERAARCGGEYSRLDSTVRKLLSNNLLLPLQ